MTQTAETKHTFDPKGEKCWCGKYHYHCADCGVDCTAGTEGGPATQDVHGVTRCWKCNGTAEKKRSLLLGAVEDLFAACKAVRRFFPIGQMVMRDSQISAIYDVRKAIDKAEGKKR